jgi:hypothetical protein
MILFSKLLRTAKLKLSSQQLDQALSLVRWLRQNHIRFKSKESHTDMDVRKDLGYSVYIEVEMPHGNPYKVRFSDHARPRYKGQKAQDRYCDMSLDPSTGLQVSDAIKEIAYRLGIEVAA